MGIGIIPRMVCDRYVDGVPNSSLVSSVQYWMKNTGQISARATTLETFVQEVILIYTHKCTNTVL